MFLITGITGKVGGAAAQRLLDTGNRVRALVRDEAKAESWKKKGVELMTGNWEDPSAMTEALKGVAGAYLMMPPNMTPSHDFHEARNVIASYNDALSRYPPPKVVALSSIGSEQTSGLGLITATHLLEQGLGNHPFPVAFVRAGSFIENYLFGLHAAQEGALPMFYSPADRKLPMIATRDIGAEVARLLTGEWEGKRVIELGSLVSPDDLATSLGEVLGRNVKSQVIPRDAWAGALEQMGLPKGGTWAYEEMLDGFNAGWIHFGAEDTETVQGTTCARDVFAAAKAAL